MPHLGVNVFLPHLKCLKIQLSLFGSIRHASQQCLHSDNLMMTYIDNGRWVLLPHLPKEDGTCFFYLSEEYLNYFNSGSSTGNLIPAY